jgi:hypothetical protein
LPVSSSTSNSNRPSALGLFSSSSFGRVADTHWVSSKRKKIM